MLSSSSRLTFEDYSFGAPFGSAFAFAIKHCRFLSPLHNQNGSLEMCVYTNKQKAR